MTRAEALTKLLRLGDLTQPEVEVIMGGDKVVLRDAMFGLMAAGDLTYRNAGAGQRLWTLTPAARAAQERKKADPVLIEHQAQGNDR